MSAAEASAARGGAHLGTVAATPGSRVVDPVRGEVETGEPTSAASSAPLGSRDREEVGDVMPSRRCLYALSRDTERD